MGMGRHRRGDCGRESSWPLAGGRHRTTRQRKQEDDETLHAGSALQIPDQFRRQWGLAKAVDSKTAGEGIEESHVRIRVPWLRNSEAAPNCTLARERQRILMEPINDGASGLM